MDISTATKYYQAFKFLGPQDLIYNNSTVRLTAELSAPKNGYIHCN